MTRFKNRYSFLIVLFILVIAFVSAIYRINRNEPKKEDRKKVSMIVYGDDSERWENMREGATLVCEDKEADLSLLTMMSENDTAEQEEIILREIEDGADALIIAACNSSAIRDFIEDKHPRVPIVFVENVESLSGEMKAIAPDDYKMGYELGQELVKNESKIVTVAIISENTNRDDVSLREKGFREAIEGKVGKEITWSRNDYERKANTRMFIQRAIVSEATDVIVTFDNTATDALLDALANLNKTRKVYSISTSNKAVYNLYNKGITVLEYPDEFSMGYLAAVNVLDEAEAKKYGNKKIEYRIVRKENMYDKDNQKLLFPFVN